MSVCQGILVLSWPAGRWAHVESLDPLQTIHVTPLALILKFELIMTKKTSNRSREHVSIQETTDSTKRVYLLILFYELFLTIWGGTIFIHFIFLVPSVSTHSYNSLPQTAEPLPLAFFKSSPPSNTLSFRNVWTHTLTAALCWILWLH